MSTVFSWDELDDLAGVNDEVISGYETGAAPVPPQGLVEGDPLWRACGVSTIEGRMVRMPIDKERIKILFLCTGNSCRSQMAEGWARHLKGDVIESYSAGIETHGLNPNAVKVMAEVGVDISRQRSKIVDELRGIEFDCVVTVCDNAHESCPLFAGKTRVVHVGFDDPPRLAKTAKTEEDALECYRRVRDEIRAFVEQLPEALRP